MLGSAAKHKSPAFALLVALLLGWGASTILSAQARAQLPAPASSRLPAWRAELASGITVAAFAMGTGCLLVSNNGSIAMGPIDTCSPR